MAGERNFSEVIEEARKTRRGWEFSVNMTNYCIDYPSKSYDISEIGKDFVALNKKGECGVISIPFSVICKFVVW